MTASVRLDDPSLLTGRCLIGGNWCEADTGETISVENPANGLTIGTVPNCGSRETAVAIAAAQDAFNGWRKRTAAERGDLLGRWHDLMLKQTGDLGGTSTTETCGRAVASEI